MQQIPMTRTAFITQSDYIPWRGYFDLIASADVFIILDDVQYTRRDWRNRNRIKAADGMHWLTIPVVTRGKYTQRVNETDATGHDWAASHWKTLQHAYGKAPHFAEVSTLLSPLYARAAELSSLSEINRLFLEALCGFLDIPTVFHWSTDLFPLETLDTFDKNQRILELCTATKCTRYISGPLAKDYMDMELFNKSGIEVRFADYSRYPTYPQMHRDFTPYVSIVDTLFNTGKKARDYSVGFAV